MKPPKNNCGSISLKALVWILVIASSLYAAYKFVPPYVAFYMLRTEVENEAKIAHMYGDEALAGRILKKAEIWSVPIGVDDIEIARGRTTIGIHIHYAMNMDFFGRWNRVQEFDIAVEEPLKETGRTLY